ncbi:MAG: DUF937 domain-containing protein [Hormoscilla sp. GM102CHS1]|nr:DUF937 domain-containing protein [Hormoscilla sp. GM102CHS1]
MTPPQLTKIQPQQEVKIMGLFDSIMGEQAGGSPTKQASPSQLGGIFGAVQMLSGNSGASFDQMQSLISIVSSFTRSSLKEKRDSEGDNQRQSLVNQFSGTLPNPLAVRALFTLPQVQQIVEVASQKTGLPEDTIQSLLPAVLPLVLNLLQTGSETDNPEGGNSVLSSFLDADGDGDVDIADAMKMTSRFLD